jgi:hypothetical protein
VKEAAVREFLGGYVAAWAADDRDAVMSHFALPLIVADNGSTRFLEDEDAVDEWIDGEAARTGGEVVGVEPLPDAAARGTVRWPGFLELLTVVEDDDGIPAIVAVERVQAAA